MLIIQRKVGERIVLGGGIEITVTDLGSNRVRLGVKAPPGVMILRGEVHDAVAAANAAALDLSPDLTAEPAAPAAAENTPEEPT